ncbi:autotransporter-associated N-terminal domain-containing protein [Fusobacterium nucleatum]|uniref:autotransporter-associated N-terminal domain-containing protein n=2 Tax=Fusobacterium nucleatum TaxID=851 RepID=UPI0030CFA3E4
MGNNNLYKVENTLRSIAKRYKSVKYSLGLAILFLMMGVGAFSEEVNPAANGVPTREEIATSRENLRNSVGSLQSKIDEARAENSKSLAGLRLELIQLMEQGDQVVKSPWMSWQFGINYMYSKWNGTYKGRGDKAEKYPFNGIYTRGNWKVRNAMNVTASNGPTEAPITPGNENTSSWKNLNSGSSGGVTIEKDSSINSGTNGNRSWGLVDLRNLQEPTNEVELLAHIFPKEVTKSKVDLNVVVNTPTTISAPNVNPQVNTPAAPPTVELPEKPDLTIPGEPTLSVNPTINLLTVKKVGNIIVNPASVTPVDFVLRPVNTPGAAWLYWGSNYDDGKFDNKTTSINNSNDFIMTWGIPSGKVHFKNASVDVNVEDARAFKVDEGRNPNGDEYIYDGGTITLKKTKNAGIDVQGTHMGSLNNIYQTKVYNRGTIKGEASGSGANEVNKHVAFTFNNFDSSNDTTRTHMINEGKIDLRAPISAGMMLRPEINQKNSNDHGGLNMMMAENKKNISISGRGSVGITVVKNIDNDPSNLDSNKNGGFNRTDYRVIIPKGHQIASRSEEANKSGILNEGKIDVQGDDSVGVGILNTIQSVVVNGEINIGTTAQNSSYSNRISGGDATKVEGATGVYTEAATRPVRGREYRYDNDGNETIVARYYDDHGRENENKVIKRTYVDQHGVTKTEYTGVTIGTETVEVGGTITLGEHAESSYGLRNKTSQVVTKDEHGNQANYTTSGSITLTGNGKIYVKGKKNFGAVAEGDKYHREIKKAADQYPERKFEVGKIDIAGLIDVTGQQSIGYVLKSGEGSNSGTIKVTGHSDNTATSTDYNGSLGFYGVKGTFTNRGIIEASGKIAHAVVAKTSNMIFNHYGTIKVDSPDTDKGNIAVYSDGNAKVSFNNGSKVYVGNYSIGIHSADKDKFNDTFKNYGTLNIKIGKESTFAYLDGDATTTLKEFFGGSKVNLEEEMGQSSSVVYASNEAKANLDTDYTITKGSNASTIALLASNKATVSVESGKTLTTNTNVALAAVDGTSTSGSGSTAQNNGTILSTRTNGGGIGIYSKDSGSKGINAGTITMQGKKAVGMYGKNVTTFENQANKIIETQKEESVGMYGEVDGTNQFTVKNNGTINIGEKKSAGIYVKNASTGSNPEENLKIENNGKINLNSGEELIGIYAPKSTVSKVGKISLTDSVTKSVATYISDGAKITDTSTAEINLGTSGKNIAYYVKNKDTSLGATAHLGKITGYGVGVYLEGTGGTDIAKLTSTSPVLNFKQGGATGNGIIGLYLKGSTNISAYNKGITVGDTVSGKYAMGIYAEGQGTSTNKYKISTNITIGKKSVGIFADKDSSNNKSYIEYKGTMNLGEGATGFYVNGEMQLDKNTEGAATINLAGGVVAYVTENSKFYGGKALVNLTKSGIGVYGKKGSTVNVDNWKFKNNGNEAEEVRLEEGQAPITGNKSLNPKMVLTHVINGETYLDSGKTVTSVDDGAIKAEQNIGLMAQGLKNKNVTGITWKEANYEIENYGTIDFSAAKKSTAIYSESARAKNDGTIKVGENSTGIYGIYKDSTRKFEGSGLGAKNRLEITTTTNSKINLGNNSTGMYLVNAQKLDNLGGEIKSTTGATKNVGIYALNGATSDAAYNKDENYNILTMNNKANITLGDGSVGIFSRGKGTAPTERNVVTNTGNVTVGKSLTNAPSVGIYSENTKLETDSNVTVGENGIAFYGKHSEITAKGTADFQNKGVLAYLENSKFTSYLGNLSATQNTMMYLKNSIANLAGSGTKVDMTVADNYTGAYVEGNSTLVGIKTVELGKNSNGLFLKNATFISDIEKITSTKEGAKGLLAINSDLTNNSKINLSGDNSIGIYSNATGKTVTNNGELTLSGKKTLGVFLKGSQTFVNTANINIADTTSTKDDEKTIGIYTSEGTSNIKHNSGIIEVGQKSIGIYSTTNSAVEMNGGKIHVKDQGIGIYKKDGTLTVKGELDIDAHTATAKNSEPAGVYAEDGANITDNASKITVGAKSYGFILNNEDTVKENVYNSTNTGTVSLGNDSVFLYSSGKAKINNGRNISSNADRLIAFYIKGTNKGKGDFTNNATIDFSNTKGSIGIYAPNGKATNKGRVLVGRTDDIDPMTGKVYTDVSKIVYGIGMAADNGGHIINDGEIRAYGNKSIGMYGKGIGTTVENNGKIYLDGSRATTTNKIQNMTGVYVDEGAKFINRGDIKTTEAYAGKNGKVNENVSGLVGVAVMNGSILENYGNIEIDADNSYGVIIRGKKDANGNVERYAVIKNYGNIRVRGRGTFGVSWKDVKEDDIKALEAQINSKLTSDPKGQELRGATGTDKDYEGVKITVKDGKPTFSRGGKPVPDSEVEKIEKIIGGAKSNLGISDVGFYIDTLGRTKPIDIDGAIAPINSQLIVGTEYSELTNKKEWFVKEDVLKPFLQQIQGRNFKLTSLAGSLTWLATPVLDNNGQIKGIAMSKLPYTSFVKKTDNAWNFADGLEQRYGMNALDSREKRLFNLLNGIGKNEQAILVQAYDEMMGHQYANVQQRVQTTGNILDKEFSYLKDEWYNPSKDSNKIKTFGTKGEYKTDTAGVIDYKNYAYGVVYVHENEDIKLGKGTGWYTGIVHNTFKFKDIGNSKEQMLQAKVGLFKSVPFDDNNSLNWTISGDIFAGYNKMHRKFLVVNEIFNAKSKYYTYGIGIKNEIGKEFRLSESFILRPYAALKLEYGRTSKIREKSGEVRLEVKHNDYFSVRPEIGAELGFKHYFGMKALKTTLGVAYENELGRVANAKNKARVGYTSAGWYNLRGEKEDRRGNVKFDLNVGIDNTRVGVTANVGYDTKGENLRGGLGLRVIF